MGRHWHRSHSWCTAVRPFVICSAHIDKTQISQYLKDSSLSMCITLFHTWLDNHWDPRSSVARLGNGSGAALTEYCPWGGRGGDRNSENLPSPKSIRLGDSEVEWTQRILINPRGYFVDVSSLAMLLANTRITLQYRCNQQSGRATPVCS